MIFHSLTLHRTFMNYSNKTYDEQCELCGWDMMGHATKLPKPHSRVAYSPIMPLSKGCSY